MTASLSDLPKGGCDYNGGGVNLEKLLNPDRSPSVGNNKPVAAPVALNDFLREIYGNLAFAEKVRTLEAFARFVNGAAGRDCADAIKGIMVVPVGFGWEFELPSSTLQVSGLVNGRSFQPFLASVYSYFLATASRSDCLRFYRFFTGCRRLKDERPALRAVEREAIQIATKRWRKDARRSLGNNGSFVAGRESGFRIHRMATPEAERALALLLPDPDRVFEEGVPLSGRGSGCSSVRVRIGDGTYFLKRYDCRGLGYRVKNIFRRSRALKVWIATWGFLARSLPVPRPLLFLEERQCRLLGRAYILSEFHEGSERLMNLWPMLQDREKDCVLIKSAMLLGMVNRFNCIHGDTNWDNLLITDRSRFDLIMVDLDCAKIPFRLSPARAFRDIQHFVRDLCREKNAGCGKKEFFVQLWRRWYL